MRIIMAGGGTGGHLFPGIALAQALKKRSPSTTGGEAPACGEPRPYGRQTKILFLCTDRPFDTRELTRYGFDHKVLSSPRLTWSPRLLIRLFRTWSDSLNIIKRFKPSYIIGLGGYGSFIPLLVSKFLNIPLVLLEQNLLPGKVTRLFSTWARWVCCQWSDSTRYLRNPLRLRITGSPLREEIQRLRGRGDPGTHLDYPPRVDRISVARKLGLNPDKKILAVIGGSQGSQALNKFVLDNLSFLKQYRERLSIIHLTGKTDYSRLKQAYQATELKHYVTDFCNTMAEIYSVADLVISRAGGIAIAEMTSLGLPLILVPYPYAAANHQYLNARKLEQTDAAILIEEKSLSPERMRFIIQEVMFKQVRLDTMSRASHRFSHPEAIKTIISLFTS